MSILVPTIMSDPLPDELPWWDDEYNSRMQITLPINTSDAHAKFQPIDLHIDFKNPCWGKNENEHSIRVCVWDEDKWHELESQIYDLEKKDPLHIKKCGLVFLVPEIANGEERYFVYYDDSEKTSPNYADHVNVEDSYYYYEPIQGIALEGDYYKIKESGFIVYAVGQKGKIINAKNLTYKTVPKKISIILDTKINPNCYKIAKNSDLLITEAVYLNKEKPLAKLHEHLTAEQAAQRLRDLSDIHYKEQ